MSWLILDDPGHLEGNTGRCFATRFAVQQALARREVNAALWEDHFPVAHIPAMRASIRKLSRWWHEETEISGALQFEGVDLSQMMEYALSTIVAGVVHEIALIEALWAEAPPGRVAVSRSAEPLRTLLADACRRRGVPLETLGDRASNPSLPARQEDGLRAGLSTLRRTVHRLWKYRRSASPYRILSSRGRYTDPLADANRDRMAFYRYSGRSTSAFIRVARWISPCLNRAARRADAARKELKRRYGSMASPRLDYRGYDLWPLVTPFLNRFFGFDTAGDGYFGSPLWVRSHLDLDTILDHLVYAGYLLEKCRPHAVVVLQDAWGLPLALVAAARARGVPSVVMQHGIPAQYSPLAADEGFMWGDYGKRFFLSRDKDMEGRVQVTGNPTRGDRVIHVDADPLRDRLCIPRKARLIFFIGQPYVGLTASDSPTFWERHVHGIFTAVSDLENSFLLVRPHPSEQVLAYEEAARAVGARNYTVNRKEDLISCLNAADLVVICNSTVSIDAMLLKKRLLVFDVSWDEPGIPFEDLGGVPRVSRVEELSAGLEAALASEPDLAAYRRFLADQIRRSGAEAARSAGDALIRLIDGRGLS
jgi:hypothetical protein